jgi:hypothetical protein
MFTLWVCFNGKQQTFHTYMNFLKIIIPPIGDYVKQEMLIRVVQILPSQKSLGELLKIFSEVVILTANCISMWRQTSSQKILNLAVS